MIVSVFCLNSTYLYPVPCPEVYLPKNNLKILCSIQQYKYNIEEKIHNQNVYSELDSFGSSTVPGHLRIKIFVFPGCQSIPIY